MRQSVSADLRMSHCCSASAGASSPHRPHIHIKLTLKIISQTITARSCIKGDRKHLHKNLSEPSARYNITDVLLWDQFLRSHTNAVTLTHSLSASWVYKPDYLQLINFISMSIRSKMSQRSVREPMRYKVRCIMGDVVLPIKQPVNTSVQMNVI